mmetsp:Transcript_26092/g.46348  ORF Transcript_26092/g.46348 Transcript_26092/m.46348 type:complete len:116 (+) Transcript_26092:4206-4553(+)
MEQELRKTERSMRYALNLSKIESAKRSGTLIQAGYSRPEWLEQEDVIILRSISLTSFQLGAFGYALFCFPLVKYSKLAALGAGFIGGLLARRYNMSEREAVIELLVQKYWAQLEA